MSWTWDPVDPSKEEPQDDPWWDRLAQALLTFFFPLGGQCADPDAREPRDPTLCPTPETVHKEPRMVLWRKH